MRAGQWDQPFGATRGDRDFAGRILTKRAQCVRNKRPPSRVTGNSDSSDTYRIVLCISCCHTTNYVYGCGTPDLVPAGAAKLYAAWRAPTSLGLVPVGGRGYTALGSTVDTAAATAMRAAATRSASSSTLDK